jgi:predicted homoserine dehydrogenase-like protein
MLNLNSKLNSLESQGKKINVGILGVGQMGSSLAVQTLTMKGMFPTLLCDRKPQRVENILYQKGLDKSGYIITERADDAQRAVEAGKVVITPRVELLWELPSIDVVVDATGVPEAGGYTAYNSIKQGKDMVMLNVEADVTVGPYLSRMAKSQGVVYTGTAGDEPGCIKELYDFADGLGFDVLVCGKGKNNPLRFDATPDDLEEEAIRKGVNPKMLTSFVDGTKTMVEMSCVANATGFLPDIDGMHGPPSRVGDLTNIFSLKDQGGILNSYRVVDFSNGVAPGVFVIFTSKEEPLQGILEYVSMGKGPNYVLYRPYHLTSIETPATIARAYFYREETIIPTYGIVAEPVAVAKKGLRAGDYLDDIGGFTFYGTIVTREKSKKENLLPIGLVNSKTKLLKDLKKGELIRFTDVELAKDSFIYKLWLKQEENFKGV